MERTMKSLFKAFILVSLTGLFFGYSWATPPQDWTWKYHRPGNTGVMGDYSDALWIDPEGTLYLGGYDPIFEEGGFSRFIPKENRWENFSNVDYPAIGDPEHQGVVRISEFCPDETGAIWMGTWAGALYFDPDVGPDSFRRYGYDNSPIPGGRTMDVDIAPDGTVWFACYSGVPSGGLARLNPETGDWMVWGYGISANGWPGLSSGEAVAVQPKPGGGYLVWVDDAYGFGRAVYDSDTEQFTELADNDQPGDIQVILANGSDDVGNVWMLRFVTPGQGYSLDYRTPEGTWVTPPQPLSAIYHLSTFRAFGDGEVLMIGNDSEALHFDGSNWTNYGHWRPGSSTMSIDMALNDDIWVSGNGGAGHRNWDTGHWQRHRLTNTGLIDNWVRDMSFAENGDLWFTCNGAPGIGGIGVFDGLRWYNFNIYTYGLGGDWPYPCDNADAICWRPSTGDVAFNPYNNGIREWDGAAFSTIETGSKSHGLAEDSFGRLWTMGNYYSLRYHDGAVFVDVSIDGWGTNVVPDPDRPGTVWACANFEVIRTDGDYRYSRENVDLPELNPLHDTFTGVVADRNGIAWLGTTEGLFRLDAESGSHQWWHSSNSDMPGDQVQPLVVSPDGLIWFTNFNSDGIEASLVWFDGTQFGTITRAQGLPHAQIYDAEVRDLGHAYELWLACASRGLAVLTVPYSDPTAAEGPISPLDMKIISGEPNPFSDHTTIRYSLQESGPVSLEIFDLRGRRIRQLVDASHTAGEQHVVWDGRNDQSRQVASGMYFVRLRADGEEARGRLVYLR